MKIVINSCYGGFSISKKAAEFMAELGCELAKAELEDYKQRNEWLDYYIQNGKHHPDCREGMHNHLEISAKYSSKESWYGYGYVKDFDYGYSRTDENLIKAVEKLGKEAGGDCANLKVVEIPDGVDYEIEEYDGFETVHEKHRSWG